MASRKRLGASAKADRATRPAAQARSGLGKSASVPSAKRIPPLGSLTGKARARPNWRGKLILQVEYNDSAWLGGVFRFTRWRDAKPDDLLPELSIVIPESPQ